MPWEPSPAPGAGTPSIREPRQEAPRLRPRPRPGSAHRPQCAPSLIQARTAPISAALRDGPSLGIKGSSSPATMRYSRLWSARPGTIAGPLLPPTRAASRVRRSRPDPLELLTMTAPAGPLHDGTDVVGEGGRILGFGARGRHGGGGHDRDRQEQGRNQSVGRLECAHCHLVLIPSRESRRSRVLRATIGGFVLVTQGGIFPEPIKRLGLDELRRDAIGSVRVRLVRMVSR